MFSSSQVICCVLWKLKVLYRIHKSSPPVPILNTEVHRIQDFFPKPVATTALNCSVVTLYMYMYLVKSIALQNFCVVKTLIPVRSDCSSVGIATRYGQDGPGIESRWRFSPPVQTGPGAHPMQCLLFLSWGCKVAGAWR